jgi:drug/metabolite transporter (DMT)-like permease
MGVVFLNKALLSNFGWHYPFSLTGLHMVSCTLFSFGLHILNLMPIDLCKTRVQLLKVLALSVVFGATVVLGNISLRFIPVSFNQAISATTPAFTAVLTFFLQAKVESPLTYSTLILVIGGIVIASKAEPSWHLIGFLACLGATCLRALKSVVQVQLAAAPRDC